MGTLYKPVMAILAADRGQQVNRVAAMFLEIVEARDAEELMEKGMFLLGPDHPGAAALDAQYKPLIAILLARRDQQMNLVKLLQLQVRDSRDGENMQTRRVGQFQEDQPAPLISPRTAALLAPQGGVKGLGGPALAKPPSGPALDREET